MDRSFRATGSGRLRDVTRERCLVVDGPETNVQVWALEPNHTGEGTLLVCFRDSQS